MQGSKILSSQGICRKEIEGSKPNNLRVPYAQNNSMISYQELDGFGAVPDRKNINFLTKTISHGAGNSKFLKSEIG